MKSYRHQAAPVLNQTTSRSWYTLVYEPLLQRHAKTFEESLQTQMLFLPPAPCLAIEQFLLGTVAAVSRSLLLFETRLALEL